MKTKIAHFIPSLRPTQTVFSWMSLFLLSPSFVWGEGGMNLTQLPEVVSTYGQKVDDIFNIILLVTGIAFIIVMVSLTYLCIVYRARKGHQATYTHGNSKKALSVSLALGIVVFISVDMNAIHSSNIAAKAIQEGYPKKEDALIINILAEQFAWNVQYAGKDGIFGKADPEYYAIDNLMGIDEDDENGYDDVISLGKLTVPIGQPVILNLNSKDVLHSFFIPNMRVKQDVVPGMTTRIWFEATKIGVYEVACAELCGLGHFRMGAKINVVSPEDYAKWFDKNSQP